MKKEVELGKVKHKCELMGDGDLQVDTFITKTYIIIGSSMWSICW